MMFWNNIIKKQYFCALSMQVFRKKILTFIVTSVAILALVNLSVQFGRIVDCFPGMNISYLLAEELAETAEGGQEKSSEAVSEIDFLLTKEYHSFQTQHFTQSIGVFLHHSGIPPHPHFDKVTPPPKVF